jgi:universal stress protein E
MLPLKTIVVVVKAEKDQQPVWLQARAWAAATGATLHVLVPVAPDVKPGVALAPGLLDMAAHNAEMAAGHWCHALQTDAPEGTVFSPVATTHTAETILHEAQRFEADLLMIGADFLEDWRPLLRHLSCPVLLVRHATAPHVVAAAVGAGMEDAPHRLLNQVVVEHLQALAPCFDAQMRVLSALPNPTELVPLMGDAYAASYVATDLESSYRESVAKQATEMGVFAEAVKVLPGRPDVALPELVRQESVDCLLLGTVARSGLAAFWLGNTAEEVLPRVDCDVLILRPQDYQAPA